MRQRHKEMMMMPFICKSMYLPVFCLLSGQGPSVDLENDTSVGDHTASCTTDAKGVTESCGLTQVPDETSTYHRTFGHIAARRNTSEMRVRRQGPQSLNPHIAPFLGQQVQDKFSQSTRSHDCQWVSGLPPCIQTCRPNRPPGQCLGDRHATQSPMLGDQLL